jgi:hypothetical protein
MITFWKLMTTPLDESEGALMFVLILWLCIAVMAWLEHRFHPEQRCPHCHGVGEYHMRSGETFHCGHCDGSGIGN